jgi:AraC family transcriptional regulator
MPTPFRHLRAQYFDAEPAKARALREFHRFETECAGLIATETRHPPHFNIPRHAHDLPSFYMVLQGGLTEADNRTSAQLPAWSVVFTPAGHIHRNTFHDQGGRCFLVELGPDWLGRLGHTAIALDQPVTGGACGLGEPVTRLWRELREPDQVSPLSAEGLVIEILCRMMRTGVERTGEAPPWLLRARDLIHDRMSEPLSLGEIAATVGVHPVHLTRTFRRRFRDTPGEYQRRLRVERAARDLVTTGRALTEIAFSCGFADQAHFSRVFKTNTGWTPARYRIALAIV